MKIRDRDNTTTTTTFQIIIALFFPSLWILIFYCHTIIIHIFTMPRHTLHYFFSLYAMLLIRLLPHVYIIRHYRLHYIFTISASLPLPSHTFSLTEPLSFSLSFSIVYLLILLLFSFHLPWAWLLIGWYIIYWCLLSFIYAILLLKEIYTHTFSYCCWCCFLLSMHEIYYYAALRVMPHYLRFIDACFVAAIIEIFSIFFLSVYITLFLWCYCLLWVFIYHIWHYHYFWLADIYYCRYKKRHYYMIRCHACLLHCLIYIYYMSDFSSFPIAADTPLCWRVYDTCHHMPHSSVI